MPFKVTKGGTGGFYYKYILIKIVHLQGVRYAAIRMKHVSAENYIQIFQYNGYIHMAN